SGQDRRFEEEGNVDGQRGSAGLSGRGSRSHLTTVNKPRRAPVVLSQEEVARLLEATPLPDTRATSRALSLPSAGLAPSAQPPCLAICSRATVTTCSGVKPNLVSNPLSGTDAPTLHRRKGGCRDPAGRARARPEDRNPRSNTSVWRCRRPASGNAG